MHEECELEKVKFEMEVMEGLSKEIYDPANLEMNPDNLENLIARQIELLEKESGYLNKLMRA